MFATTATELGRELVERAGGAVLEDGGFESAHRRFTGADDLLRLAMPDPVAPGLPLAAWIGGDGATLATTVERCEFSFRPRFECYRERSLVMWGALTPDGPVVEGDVDDLRARRRDEELGRPGADARADGRLHGDERIVANVVEHRDPVEYVRLFGSLDRVVVDRVALRVDLLAGAFGGASVEDIVRDRVDVAPSEWDRCYAGPRDSGERTTSLERRPLPDRVRGAGLFLPTDRVALARVEEPLRELAALGANSVHLVYLEPLLADATHAVATTWRSDARDLGAIHSKDEVRFAVAAAKRAGLAVLLERELLVSPTNDVAASPIQLATEEARARFATDFRRSTAAFAAFAEELAVEGVVLGTDLRSVTRTPADPQEPANEAEGAIRAAWSAMWRDVVADVRAVYGGAVVYAARDPWEVDRTDFQGSLDAVGLAFQPVFEDLGGEVRAKGLADAYRWMLGKAEESAQGRDVLLLRAGVPAASLSFRDPRLPRGPLDVAFERESIEALDAALAATDGPCRGALLWEWTVDPEKRGGRGPDLRRAEYEDALRAFFAAE
ncbi:MAG: hypothetical protein R3F34_19610 [Planctomycetota bacterium]